MESFSVWHWLVIFLVALPFFFSGASKRGSLVIKQWKAGNRPDAFKNFVSIAGRKSGVAAWFLSILRIDPTTTIRVGIDRIEFSTASLAGIESRMLPLQNVCSAYYGYYKPWRAAVVIFAVFAFIGILIGAGTAEAGSQGGAFIASVSCSCVGALVSLIYYFLNRTLTLGFVENSGQVLGIRFKRSVIENVDINQEQAREVCVLIQQLIELKERSLHRTSSTQAQPTSAS